MNSTPILVIGSSGKTGRRIAQRLADRGVAVRLGARRAPIPFDWDNAETWPAALEGVGAAYISYHPDLAAPGAPEKIHTLTEAARAAGVGRLVLLSGRGEACAQECERIVAASGLAHTRVRCAWFAQNFSEGALAPAVAQGVVALPAGDVREPLVDVDDIADVAAAALTEDGHAGRLYEVTGPRLLSFHDAAAALSAAIGRPVRYTPIGFEAFRAGMAATAGDALADLVTAIARETLDGRNAFVGDGVRQALGRAPRSFEAFCRAAAAAGAWSRAA